MLKSVLRQYFQPIDSPFTCHFDIIWHEQRLASEIRSQWSSAKCKSERYESFWRFMTLGTNYDISHGETMPEYSATAVMCAL